jgi:hypothetical protein
MENMDNTENMYNMDNMDDFASLGHPKGISKATEREKIVAEELIELINFNEALVYDAPKALITARKIPNRDRKVQRQLYKTEFSSFRLDFQGLDKDKPGFARYAIQCKNKTFAQIHLKINQKLGAERIREAFLESLNTSVEVRLKD